MVSRYLHGHSVAVAPNETLVDGPYFEDLKPGSPNLRRSPT
jgi:hypothetical protein